MPSLVRIKAHTRRGRRVAAYTQRRRKTSRGGAGVRFATPAVSRPHMAMKPGDRVTALKFGNKRRKRYRIDRVYPTRPETAHLPSFARGVSVEAWEHDERRAGLREKANFKTLHAESIRIVDAASARPKRLSRKRRRS